MTDELPLDLTWRDPADLPRDRMIIVKSVSGFVAVAIFNPKSPDWPWVVIDRLQIERMVDADGEETDATRVDGWPEAMIASWQEIPS